MEARGVQRGLAQIMIFVGDRRPLTKKMLLIRFLFVHILPEYLGGL
jgi:hypothetical protein